MYSCTTLFNHSTRQTIQKNDKSNIEKVQFYTDRTILLEYKSKTQDDDIKNGKVEIKEGYYYYFIEIPKKTQCVAEHLNNSQISLKFEEGNNRLIFGWNKSDNLYYLNGKTKKGKYYVEYEGKDFLITEGLGTKLLIKKNNDIKSETEKRKVSGVKVN